MNINISLTNEQKESIKIALFSELTTKDLIKELYSKLSVNCFRNEENLRNELYNYLKNNK
jgi:hypothetical protein